MSLPIPGECYWLPSEEGSHDDKGTRPHVVLSPAANNSAVATFAFASKSALQASRFDAPHVLVQETSPLFDVTGFSGDTYIYPSRLAVALTSEVPPRARGRIVDEFPELRDEQLPKAVGLTTGTSQIGLARGSRRGHVAVFSEWFSGLIGTEYGLVVSWPRYSLTHQVQNIVPLFDASEYRTVSPNFAVSGEQWIKQLESLSEVLFMIDLVQSAYDGGQYLDLPDRDIVRYLDTPVSASTMQSVDEALSQRLFGTSLRDLALR